MRALHGNRGIGTVLDLVLGLVLCLTVGKAGAGTPGDITTVAGNGGGGYSGDGGAATAAQISVPYGVALDSSENLFIADGDNGVIRKVDTGGTITTVPGVSTGGFSGVAVDAAGNLYVTSQANQVFKVTPGGTVTLIAGTGANGYSGDGGPATSAELNTPTGVAVDASGNVYLADFHNNVIRKVDGSTDIITTFAGNGIDGYSGDGGPATSARLFNPSGVAVDFQGNLILVDAGNNRIRKVDHSTGNISTVAGNGAGGYTGDGGPATSAELAGPLGVAVDIRGNLFIADNLNNVIREVNGSSGIISTIAGNGTGGYSGDGGVATSAELFEPYGVGLDNQGNLFIADTINNRVREVFQVAATTLALNQSVSLHFNTNKAITLTATVTDGHALTYSVVTSPSHGTLTGTAPNLTYHPTRGYTGADSFTFKAFNGAEASNTATVSLTITDTAPVASGQSVSTTQGVALPITLSATDPDGDPITSYSVTSPAHGALTGTAPNLTYTPTAGYTGADSFTFKAADGALFSTPATVSITVTSNPPVANSQSVSLHLNTNTAITLTATVSNGHPLTYQVVTSPAHGTLTGTAPNLTYHPTRGYVGSDSFTFKALDGTVASNIATVSLTITDTAPNATPQSVSTTQGTALPITLSATDPDGDPITVYSVVTSPAHGTLTGTAPNLTYTPTSSFAGADSFTFKAADGALFSTPATISITVTPNPPTAPGQSVFLHFNTNKAITLTATDTDGHTLTYQVVTSPAHGTLTGTAPNLTFHPTRGYVGSDSFTFKALDGTVASNIATVSLSVTDTAPVATGQSVSTTQGVAKAITLSATDADGDPITVYSVVTQPAHGTLTGTAPNLTYTPTAGYTGSDSFTFKAADGALFSSPATVSITVNP